MRAGKHRHPITIQKRVLTQDEYGDSVETWQDFARTNASVVPISAREFFKSAQVQADITHTVTLRYLPGVTSEMRVRFGTRIFHVGSAINLEERNVELQLLCKESV